MTKPPRPAYADKSSFVCTEGSSTDVSADKNADSAARRLAAAEFQGLVRVPAAVEWFANLANNPRTRRAYQGDIEEFCQFVGLHTPEQFREVTRPMSSPSAASSSSAACSITCSTAMRSPAATRCAGANS